MDTPHSNKDDPIKKAQQDLAQVERNKAEIERLEGEIEALEEDAVHQIERAEHEDHREVTIIVNGTPHQVPKNEKVTYAQIVTFAHPDYPQNTQITYSVTYTIKGDERILPPGGSVKVKEGMEFLVNRSGQS
jgi:hypothetical protein